MCAETRMVIISGMLDNYGLSYSTENNAVLKNILFFFLPYFFPSEFSTHTTAPSDLIR